MKRFRKGELFIYENPQGICELGKVKRVANKNATAYYCWYHQGETSELTSLENMHKLINSYLIEKERLGGIDAYKIQT